ncbi:Fic family protein [Actinokineospora diospyrosa]|uniref:Fic/DOC family protein n=1 Tax=Actinokineospora diospyrosa TaxID=103728 RepID=A0ABT1IKX8_9PSEU|nr:Fic family protein [Actinokineospora diospyrosa]MCP2273310.1 Fic/DOC family protein [Actinokineospora diospyrosa]
MIDHLRIWCQIREQVPWHDIRHGPGWPHTPVQPRRDGLIHRITTVDHARDPARAQRLLAAYDQFRADTARPLDFGLLAQWQKTVLGVDHVPFRSGPAFAKAGREHYGLDPDTPALFDLCLAGAEDPTLPIASRAARAYLDICFFHPFPDGNARSALLALTFVLAKHNIVLDQVGPLTLQRPANDPNGAHGLATLVVTLIENTQRRAASAL